MLKFIGLGLIMAAGSAMGFIASSGLSKRVIELELILMFLQKTQTAISYCQTPTSELIEEMASCEIFRPLYFISDCSQLLRRHNNFTKQWKIALNQNKKKLSLNQEDMVQLLNIGDYLGASDVKSQITALQLTESILKQNLSDAKIQSDKKGKMYKSLGILAGVGISIFFI